MTVLLAASHRHYLDHALPVWRALPADIRGDAFVERTLLPLLPGARPLQALRPGPEPVLLAGFDDLRRLAGRRAILMEHGIGQSYAGDPAAGRNPAYAGGEGRHGVAAFLCPNEYAAARNRAANPGALTTVIGSPRLAELQAIDPDPRSDRPVVAFTFHWDCPLTDETRSGWGHWCTAIADLAASGRFEILGSSHPRSFPDMQSTYRRIGVEPVGDFREVLRRADVLCADNTSAMYDWAWLRGPTVVLDTPDYRQHVHHGLRFWDCADIGPRILDPAGLPVAIEAALAERPWPGAEPILERVFPPVANPAQKAAEAVVEALGRRCAPRSSVTFPKMAPFPG